MASSTPPSRSACTYEEDEESQSHSFAETLGSEGESHDMRASEEVRALAEECFVHTIRTELGEADRLCCEETGRQHPRMLLEAGHVSLMRAVLNSDVAQHIHAIDTYVAAADMALGFQTIVLNKRRQQPSSFSQRWAVWAAASVTQIAGTPSPHRKHTPLKALSPIRPCPCQRADEEEEEVVSRSEPIKPIDAALLQLKHLQETEDAREETQFAETLQDTVDPYDMTQDNTLTATASVERGTINMRWTQDAIILSDTIEEASSPALPTVEDMLDIENSVVAAEAYTLAALLQLKALRYVEAGKNLRKAWETYQPLQQAVREHKLPQFLEDDVKLGVGMILASAVELPDGLRKVLGSVGSLATPPSESDWLVEVFSRGGHRSLHAGIVIVLRQLSKPRSHIEDSNVAAIEAQVLQALLLRHPNSVILHLMCSLQRRRYGDPRGALDAVAAAKRAWTLPSSAWSAGRQPNSSIPPAVTMANADAHLASLQYKEAARLYRSVIDAGTVAGEQLAFQGSAAIRLAGAMTFLGLQKWPSKPWGNADEWILRSVVAARSDRQDEEAVGAVAARFSHHSHLRPLLPFWLLFIMGDLEALGPQQQTEVITLLERLGKGNPSRPPKEDFMAYAEGRGLHRLLLGAALRTKDPIRAKELWCETLTDRNIPNESIAIAYTQCLMGEEEVKVPHRMELGVRMLIKGSGLPGDGTPFLRMRYGSTMQSLPWKCLEGQLPLAWAIVLRLPDEEEDAPSEYSLGSDEAENSKRNLTSTSQWLQPVMKKRVETIEMVNSMLGKLNTSVSAPSSLRGNMAWKRPVDSMAANTSQTWSRPAQRLPSESNLRRVHVGVKRSGSRVSIALPSVTSVASSEAGVGNESAQILRAVHNSMA